MRQWFQIGKFSLEYKHTPPFMVCGSVRFSYRKEKYVYSFKYFISGATPHRVINQDIYCITLHTDMATCGKLV